MELVGQARRCATRRRGHRFRSSNRIRAAGTSRGRSRNDCRQGFASGWSFNHGRRQRGTLHIDRVAKRFQPLLLFRGPHRAHAASGVLRQRFHTQYAGPDDAYTTPIASKARGRSMASTAITTGTRNNT